MLNIDALIQARQMTNDDKIFNFYQEHSITPPSSLFDVLTDTFYFAKNCDGQFVYANRLLHEQFKLSDPKLVIGKTDYDFFRVDIADNIRADDIRVMNEDIIIQNKPEVLQDGKGGLHWLFTTKAPLKNSEGVIVGVEGFSKDAQRSQNTIEPYNAFKECVNYLQKHYMNNVSIEYLAELSYMSLSTFERKFKKHFACTPKQYIKKIRIQEACNMLIAGYNIQRVAIDCGFCDQSYFTREFRLSMGVTPKSYQSSQQASPIIQPKDI